jgi:hypothetical protein
MSGRALMLGLVIASSGVLSAQAPPGHHLGAAVMLPDSLSETILGGRFRATVRRTARNARERQLLAVAERLYPDRETILASARDKKMRDLLIAMDTATGGGPHIGFGQIAPRAPGTLTDRWWTWNFDGTWLPFAVSGQAVQYYLERLRDIAAGRGQFPQAGRSDPDHGTFEYTASVEATQEAGASHVVRMRMRWDYWCGFLCAMEFVHDRAVWFDANGTVLRVTGDEQPLVIVS